MGKKHPCVSFTVKQVKIIMYSIWVGVVFLSEGILLFNSEGWCDLPWIVNRELARRIPFLAYKTKRGHFFNLLSFKVS